ncbi:MAG: LysM peptidoglycan-binding domain-containing protein [Chitinophagaceae bacterium]|jgi:nucleoid-associated protein YgaU|nr:LysM peptidoglycan-binding domain-containing protein [Flavisolibacter sp.]
MEENNNKHPKVPGYEERKSSDNRGDIGAEYTIEERDTLEDIAKKYDISIDEIIAANNDVHDKQDLIEPGKKIIIPNKK